MPSTAQISGKTSFEDWKLDVFVWFGVFYVKAQKAMVWFFMFSTRFQIVNNSMYGS